MIGHGGESKDNEGEYLVLSKKNPGKGESFSLQEDILDYFNNSSCVGLIDKPQVFVVLSCRGERENASEVDPSRVPARVSARSNSVNLAAGMEKAKVPTISDRSVWNCILEKLHGVLIQFCRASCAAWPNSNDVSYPSS